MTFHGYWIVQLLLEMGKQYPLITG